MYCLRIKRTIVINSLVVMLVILCGCAQPRAEHVLFAIDSLVTAQVDHLSKVEAGLHKEAVLSGKKSDSTYVPGDSLSWAKELEIFRELEVLNKPVSRASYLVDDGLYDPGSNLTVKAFSSLEKELAVQSLRVFYQDQIERPRKIEAVLNKNTFLYSSSRLMTLEFSQLHNKTVLTSYSIDGGQKMMLGDSVVFSIKGNIQYQK
jgi:hypothetical protein